METIEQWALREGVRQVQKQCGKASQWCDQNQGAIGDFDEADAQFWLRWATEIQSCVDAMVGIVDRQMSPRDPADWPPEVGECHEPECKREDRHLTTACDPRREPDGTPKDPRAADGCTVHDACELADDHPGPCCPASVMYCDIKPECDRRPGHDGACCELAQGHILRPK